MKLPRRPAWRNINLIVYIIFPPSFSFTTKRNSHTRSKSLTRSRHLSYLSKFFFSLPPPASSRDPPLTLSPPPTVCLPLSPLSCLSLYLLLPLSSSSSRRLGLELRRVPLLLLLLPPFQYGISRLRMRAKEHRHLFPSQLLHIPLCLFIILFIYYDYYYFFFF